MGPGVKQREHVKSETSLMLADVKRKLSTDIDAPPQMTELFRQVEL